MQMRLAYCASHAGRERRPPARALLDEALLTGRGRFPFLDVRVIPTIALLEDPLDEALFNAPREPAAAVGWKR